MAQIASSSGKRRMVSDIKRQLTGRMLSPGDRISSTASLAKQYGIALMTAHAESYDMTSLDYSPELIASHCLQLLKEILNGSSTEIFQHNITIKPCLKIRNSCGGRI